MKVFLGRDITTDKENDVLAGVGRSISFSLSVNRIFVVAARIAYFKSRAFCRIVYSVDDNDVFCGVFDGVPRNYTVIRTNDVLRGIKLFTVVCRRACEK